jgi:hypothetical protein
MKKRLATLIRMTSNRLMEALPHSSFRRWFWRRVDMPLADWHYRILYPDWWARNQRRRNNVNH